jgi:lantibiotic modifying enzyme
VRNQRNLTGFSHGAAGAGYALLALFHATGDAQYREAAMLAFQYERHWFDPTVGNWPDFRGDPVSRYWRKRPLAFATLWCHGAPGIALSRLRAYEMLNDEICKAEALTALQTTRKMIESTLSTGLGNFSLCHGLAGNAEVLLYGSQVLGPECGEAAAWALHVAHAGMERYATRRAPWPCGTYGGETPNLMLGLAGIGHYYLRLHCPATPSILILPR